MFSKLHNIKDFGVFSNFSGRDLTDFRSFNLIYGWNYSGKTTLSRVFRSIELGELHTDFSTSSFRIDCDDGSQITEATTTPPIVRVFNEDFRNSNFQWNNENNIEPILLLGETNIANKEAFDKTQADLASTITDLTKLLEETEDIKSTISKSESKCGTLISKELGIPRFDKRHVQKIISEFNRTYPDLLSDEAFKTYKSTALSNDRKDNLQEITVRTPAFLSLSTKTSTILKKSVASSKMIDHLISNPRLSQWVEHGRELHQDKDECEFCGNPISKNRIEELNAHFSKEFENLKTETTELIAELENASISINGALYVKAGFYNELHDDWEASSVALNEALSTYNATVQSLKDALIRKLENPFETACPTSFENKTESLQVAIAQFNKIIEQNNQRSSAFQKSKDDAIEALKRHYCVEAMREIDRFNKDTRIFELEDLTKKKKVEKKKLDDEIQRLQALLSEATKGAETLNKTLEHFFGKNDIQITVNADDKYVLMRGTRQAKNLSEGEKTAICFAYFIVKLLENDNILSDTIVYIDDPISSLDANHLMNVHAFIKDTFYKFDKDATPKHQCLAKQLFISTHNYDFFHLVWEWMSGTKREQHGAYLIQRTDTEGLVCSNICDCPDSIKKYRSEYLFLFVQLANYIDSPSSDMQVIFNLGNMARRFVEGYFSFKYLNHTKIDDHINELVPDTMKAERVRKFMHFYSHSLKREGGLKLPDMSEAKAVLEIILEAIKVQDAIHYTALEEAK